MSFCGIFLATRVHSYLLSQASCAQKDKVVLEFLSNKIKYLENFFKAKHENSCAAQSQAGGGGHCVFKWILRGHLKPPPSARMYIMFEVISIKF